MSTKNPMLSLAFIAAILSAQPALADEEPLTMAAVMAAAGPQDWRSVEPENALYMQLPQGVVVFELAPQFAPATIANIRKLVQQRFFDGLAIVRSQDNYVVQWGDPAAGTPQARPHGDAADTLTPEFYRDRQGLNFEPLNSRDSYADEVGFVDGFPAGRDADRAWLTHCYGMLGVGRATPVDSGSGAELYVITGHAPRHLDRNVVLIGRVLVGMELLSTLPRGTGPLGFYEQPEQFTEIQSIRFGNELPASMQLSLQVMRTDTDRFRDLVAARTHRLEDWFTDPAGRIGVCNVPLPVRTTPVE